MINDEYIQDIKSLLKLYPKQSFSAKPTKTQSGVKVPKAIIDEISDNGGEVEICFKHDLANTVSGYLIARENSIPVNTNDYGTAAFYLTSGKINYSFYWDGSMLGACVIPVSSLEDGAYYVAKLTVAAILSFTLQKLTKTGNLNTLGTVINSTTTPKGVTKANADMGVFAGCYSSGSLANGSKHEIVYIEFKNNLGVCLSTIYMCNGNENLLTDVCTGNNYTILNEDNFPSFWNHKQDYFHYNFKNGHTLYYNETSELYLRIPNKIDGSEIVLVSIPSGYERIENYKECRKTFNNCESKFKLDDVSEVSRDVLAVCPDTFYNGLYVRQNDELYICTANNSEISISGGTWRFRNRTTYAIPYVITRVWPWQTNPALEDWSVVGVTCSNPVVLSNQDLYLSDPDHVLFTEGTGVAKEFEIGSMYSEIVDSVHDRGHLYINSDSDKNFMLYKTDKGVDTPADLKIWAYVEK